VRRLFFTVLVVAAGGLVGSAQVAKDTQPAAATRKKLQAKISVEFKDTRLEDALKEMKQLVEEAGAGSLSFQYDLGVSRNLTVTYTGKDETLEKVLDGTFQKNGLGYVVVSKDKDRYDGWILIKQGNERGYPEGQSPAKTADKTATKDKPPSDKASKDKDKPAGKDKPVDDADKAEQLAASRLNRAKDLLDAGKGDKAKEWFQDIIKTYPKTKAADEARKLLEKLNK
jgi:TolA-binding protein